MHPYYRYHVEPLSRNVRKQAARLNELGMGGWRLVSVDGGKAYFVNADTAPEAPGRLAAAEKLLPEVSARQRQIEEGRPEED